MTDSEASRLPPDAYEVAVAEAMADTGGEVVAECACDKCHKVIATVGRTRRGLLFTSKVKAFDVWPQIPGEHQAEFPDEPILYLVNVLLDHADLADRDPTRAGCASHGERRVDAADLLARVRTTRPGKKRGWYSIACDGVWCRFRQLHSSGVGSAD